MSAVQSASSSPSPRLIRLRAVVSMVGLSKSEVWRRIAAGKFPKPIKLGPNTSAFVEAEVAEWVRLQIEANPPEARR